MTYNNISVIQKTFDLIAWFVPRLEKLPSNYRRSLGARIEETLYDVLADLIRARYRSRDTEALDDANMRLDLLRYQIRLLVEFHLLDDRRYEHVSRAVNVIGTELGAWRKHRVRQANEASRKPVAAGSGLGESPSGSAPCPEGETLPPRRGRV